jgi:hypothetical protein
MGIPILRGRSKVEILFQGDRNSIPLADKSFGKKIPQVHQREFYKIVMRFYCDIWIMNPTKYFLKALEDC